MSDVLEKLERLGALLASGVLTQEEFQAQKALILGSTSPQSNNSGHHGTASPQTSTESHSSSDEEVIKVLTDIKGIGVWSAQMFLMFQLQRPDVFAPRDLGLKKAMSVLYGYSMEEPEKFWAESAKVWSPFRTLASLHLWKMLDNK